MRKIPGAAGFALVCMAHPAAADLTAEQVLANQLNALTFGGNVEVATEGMETSDSGITVDAFVLTAEDATFRVDGLELRERPDGSVEVIYPERLNITSSHSCDADVPCTNSVTLSLEGVKHIVSGTPDDITHAIGLKRLALADHELKQDDATFDGEVEFTLTDTETVLHFLAGDTPSWSVDFQVGAFHTALSDEAGAQERVGDRGPGEIHYEFIDFAVDLTDLDGGVTFRDLAVPEHTLDVSFEKLDWRQNMIGNRQEVIDLTMSADDFELAWDMRMSFDEMEADAAAALNAGQSITARIAYESMGMDMTGESFDGPVASRSYAGETEGAFSLDRTGVSIAMTSQDNKADITLPPQPGLPFTSMSYTLARSLLDVGIPFLATGDAEPFHIRIAMEEFEIAEPLWSVFDPGQRLPRDPITFNVDLEGTTKLAMNLFDADSGEKPFVDTTARLNALRLNIAGAELTATGEAEDTSVDGVPDGTGRLDARLTGFHALLDTLIDMGLLTDSQAMPARMGLNMIARPDGDPDTLVSTIEVTEDGAITANGQRIR